jgi:type IV secretory pathway TrbD component
MMLPQMMIIAGMSVALWVAARWIRREVARVDSEMRRAQTSLDRVHSDRMPRLQLDSETGRYYPVK